MKTGHLSQFFILRNKSKGKISEYVKNSINFFWAISSERRIGVCWMKRYKIIEH